MRKQLTTVFTIIKTMTLECQALKNHFPICLLSPPTSIIFDRSVTWLVDILTTRSQVKSLSYHYSYVQVKIDSIVVDIFSTSYDINPQDIDNFFTYSQLVDIFILTDQEFCGYLL